MCHGCSCTSSWFWPSHGSSGCACRHLCYLQVVLHSPDSIAPVGVLHPTAFHVECKQQTAGHQAGTSADQQQQQAEPVVIEVPAEWTPNQQVQGVAINGTGSAAEHQQLQQQSCWHTDVKVLESAEQIQITATVSAAAAGDVQPVTAAGTAVALGAGLSSMTACLSDLGVSWSHSLFVHMYLADMAHFGAANAEYCKHLPQVNPPSRACVQVSEAGGIGAHVLLAGSSTLW